MVDFEARILFALVMCMLVLAAWQIDKLRKRVERLERDTLRACPEREAKDG